MHNLKPNTEYVLLNLRVAVKREDFESGQSADGISAMMDCGMFEANGSDGVIGDWIYTDPCVLHVASGMFDSRLQDKYTTGDTVEEGETFNERVQPACQPTEHCATSG